MKTRLRHCGLGLATALLSIPALADAPSEANIIGGAPTGGFPAVGMLEYDLGNGQAIFCSAAVIAPTKLLTAGHCVLNDRSAGTASWQTNRFTFYTGTDAVHSASSSAQSVRVDTPQEFARYSQADTAGNVPESFSESDIAVVTLGSPVNVTPLPFAANTPGAGSPVTLVGYGLTDANNGSSYGIKNTTTTQMQPQGADQAVLHWGDGTHTVCHGDSGSPVLVSQGGGYAIIAVSSTTTGNCNGQGNGPATSKQRGWIDSVAGTAPNAGLTPGSYYSIRSVATGGALDVTNASSINGTRIQQWQYSGGANQRWTVAAGSRGDLEIVNMQSGACIDIPNGTTAQGTAAEQWGCWAGPMQSWRLQPVNGAYQVVNQASGQCLDVAGWSSANGTPIIQWPCTGGANQQWQFVPIDFTGNPAGTQPQACFYIDINYTNLSFCAAPGTIVSLPAPFAASISSVRVPAGHTVTLFSDVRLQGRYVSLTRDSASLFYAAFNDVSRSVMIQ